MPALACDDGSIATFGRDARDVGEGQRGRVWCAVPLPAKFRELAEEAEALEHVAVGPVRGPWFFLVWPRVH